MWWVKAYRVHMMILRRLIGPPKAGESHNFYVSRGMLIAYITLIGMAIIMVVEETYLGKTDLFSDLFVVAVSLGSTGVFVLVQFLTRRGLLRAPGTRAERICRFVFPKKAFDEIFSQAIIDMRDEHAEALSLGKFFHAWWIVVRGNLGLILTGVSYVAVRIAKSMVEIWKIGS